MKQFLSVAVILFFCTLINNLFAENAPSSKVTAFYFYGSFRCPTCHKLEEYAREAIEMNFKEALASGKLEFKPVNVEETGNEHFIRDYNLYTKALVISLKKEGREIKSENLSRIWELVRDKPQYMEYVKDGISRFLKDS